MKTKVVLWVIAVGLVATAAGIAQAQDKDTTTTQQTTTTTTTQNDANNPPSAQNDTSAMANPNETHSNVRTLTGCLQKGEGTDEYMLTGQDGSTWEVRSDAVDLASHVNQTVTITGAVAHSTMHGMKEDTKREAQEHGMDKSATEHGHLTATNMSVVSSSCSR